MSNHAPGYVFYFLASFRNDSAVVCFEKPDKHIDQWKTRFSHEIHIMAETKFSQVRPIKRGGGRRYYRPEDVQLLSHIRSLLYDEGYTIKGVQKLMREGTLKRSDLTPSSSDVDYLNPNNLKSELQDAIDELKALKAEINTHR